jgi:hypothetical protein
MEHGIHDLGTYAISLSNSDLHTGKYLEVGLKASNVHTGYKTIIINFRQAFSLFLRKRIVMSSIISEGVQVSVETFYQPDYSNPIQSEFMFAYRITLENHNSFPVKLHRRN